MQLRWAETVSDSDVKGGPLLDFWAAVLLFAVPMSFYSVLGSLATLFLLGLFAFHRQLLRRHYNLEFGTVGTVVGDIFTWMCCCFCAAAQEARQVKHNIE